MAPHLIARVPTCSTYSAMATFTALGLRSPANVISNDSKHASDPLA